MQRLVIRTEEDSLLRSGISAVFSLDLFQCKFYVYFMFYPVLLKINTKSSKLFIC